jgi:hypothetical protein
MDGELEAVRQQGLEHQPHRFRRCGGRSRGDHIESVRLQPVRAPEHPVRVEVVGARNEVQHRGLAQLIPAPAQDAATYERIRAFGADVDVRDVKGGRGLGGLAECRAGQKDDEADTGKCSHHRSDLRQAPKHMRSIDASDLARSRSATSYRCWNCLIESFV